MEAEEEEARTASSEGIDAVGDTGVVDTEVEVIEKAVDTVVAAE